MSSVLLVAILKTANTECENSGSLHGARFFLQINLIQFNLFIIYITINSNDRKSMNILHNLSLNYYFYDKISII